MQKDITMQVRPTGAGYEITIPDLEDLTVSGATWTEALVKASEAIGQARDAEAREILARKRQNKAARNQQTGKTVA
jgi:predicted RNase H-like HicB family nuclease